MTRKRHAHARVHAHGHLHPSELEGALSRKSFPSRCPWPAGTPPNGNPPDDGSEGPVVDGTSLSSLGIWRGNRFVGSRQKLNHRLPRQGRSLKNAVSSDFQSWSSVFGWISDSDKPRATPLTDHIVDVLWNSSLNPRRPTQARMQVFVPFCVCAHRHAQSMSLSACVPRFWCGAGA